jgi:hypothetical protein
MTKHYLRYVLAGALAFAFSLPLGSEARADHDWNNECHQRLQRQKDKIDHDAARYGKDSPKVRHDIDKLEQERQWCRDHHADWDHNVFDIGIYLHH